MAIACIGTARIERRAHATDDIAFGETIPVAIRSCHGGAARNVAEDLARLGARRVALVACVGADAEGMAILAGLEAAGVDTTMVARSVAHATASRTVVVDRGGTPVLVLADDGANGEVTALHLQMRLPDLARWPVWLVDGGLPAESLRFLLRNKPAHVRLGLDALTLGEGARLDGLLEAVDFLFVRPDNLARIAHIPVRSPLDLCTAGTRLLDSGARLVMVHRGTEGVFLAAADAFEFLPPLDAQVRDGAGAADALVAGTLLGRLGGRPSHDAALLGLACAALTVETGDTVNPGLSASAALTRAGLHNVA